MCTVVPQHIYDCLKKVVKEDLDNYEITLHEPNKKGEGFLGEMIYVSLQDRYSNESQDLVVKQAFTNEMIRKETPIRKFYLNEIYFYTKVWKRLDTFQERIPSECQFKKMPKCLNVFSENNSEKLIMENLKMQNFEIYNKKVPVDSEHFEYIFKEYGKFHALSFAYKALYPEDYEDLSNGLSDTYSEMSTTEGFRKSMKILSQICMDTLLPGIDDAVIEKYKEFDKNMIEIFQLSLDVDTKYSVITHGDCWSNNMMFKYDEQRKLSDMRFLDFQLAKIGSPCCDLSYCLYSGASQKDIDNLDHYLHVYYESLSKTLRAFGCDPEQLCPLQGLKEDWKRYCKLGYIMSFMIWRLKYTYEGEVKDLTDNVDDSEDFYRTGYDKEGFDNTIRNLILHLYENNYL